MCISLSSFGHISLVRRDVYCKKVSLRGERPDPRLVAFDKDFAEEIVPPRWVLRHQTIHFVGEKRQPVPLSSHRCLNLSTDYLRVVLASPTGSPFVATILVDGERFNSEYLLSLIHI